MRTISSFKVKKIKVSIAVKVVILTVIFSRGTNDNT